MTVNLLEEAGIFEGFPIEVLEKIIAQCPIETVLFCKDLRRLVTSALKGEQWNPIKNNENYPENFRRKLQQIEKDSPQGKNGGLLISTFFQCLHTGKSIKELDFSNLGYQMLEGWQADQDYNLLQCWSRISHDMNLLYPLNTAKDVRDWMSDNENQKRLGEITALSLSGLKLTNLPEEISYFTGLKLIDLRNNLLQNLPAGFVKLTKLNSLNLSNNKFKRVPNEILNLVELTSLGLANNQIVSVSGKIENLKELKTLSLCNNRLASLPLEIGCLTELISLDLGRNKLESLPSSFWDLAKLQTLYLGNNKLITLPDQIGNLKELSLLILGWNLLASIPAAIGDLPNLVVLNLVYNQLTSVPELANLSGLQKLNLGYNRLHTLPDIFPEFGKKPTILVEGNLLLVVPESVLKKFEINTVESIEPFISLREGKYTSSFKLLCQFIRKNCDFIFSDEFEPKEKLAELVELLKESDRIALLSKILGKDYEKMKEDLFKDMKLFVSALAELIYEKEEIKKNSSSHL